MFSEYNIWYVFDFLLKTSIKTGIIFGYFLHCINFNNSKQLSES